ncbi:hypothetical protein IWX49DRAFT_550384 [Phyllosticta citricarpa]|uniref:Uncharacterized protein n=2 Tax=Phyllosticta TaxID=121621 RepID=A0ABR1MNS1_9PEZI
MRTQPATALSSFVPPRSLHFELTTLGTSLAPPPSATTVSAAGRYPAPYETHERHDTYTTSLDQRQQQAQQYYRAHESLSRRSSSSGSITHSLRRTPNFEDVRRGRSASPAQRPQESARESVAPPPTDSAHPALRISRRTQAAILFTLEEALRAPYQFTPDLAEENAQMSDLLGGTGARSAPGPVPVQQQTVAPMRTPQQIMRARQDREARRQREAEVAASQERAEQERRAQQEERRKSAERRAAAAGVAGQTQPYGRSSGDGGFAGYTTAGPRPTDKTAGNGGPVISPSSGRAMDPAAGVRPRGPSLSQGQPRVPPQPTAAAASARFTQQPQSQPRQSATAPQARPGASAGLQSRVSGDGQQRDPTVSTFPHAFERWEQLSSHWEGLTSYWIRRLEQNQDEMSNQSLTQQMSRQITDLSAAGANLFHAVVELQRLRASSERKFQRWFYETRSEQERQQETIGQLQKAIEAERAARAEMEGQVRIEKAKSIKADKMVAEMQRELAISKDEARRAWEELGRREQEERERVVSLREGQPTLVGGVQVVPMGAGMVSRHGSQRSQAISSHSQPLSANIEGGYTYEEPQSPTDTDPFTGRQTPSALRHEPDIQSLAQGTYQPTGALTSAGTAPSMTRTAAQPASLQPHSRTASGASQPSASSPRTQPAMPSPGQFYQHGGSFLPGGREPVEGSTGPGDDRSYVPSSVGDTESIIAEEEYLMDDDGNYILDLQGRRIPFRRASSGPGRMRSPTAESASEPAVGISERIEEEELEEGDDYEADIARERELAARYGIAATTSGPTIHQGYTTAAGPEPSFATTSGYAGGEGQPDYTGSGYGGTGMPSGFSDWASVRHHHPTRLSDVLEEDERSRTSPSRASQASRGLSY